MDKKFVLATKWLQFRVLHIRPLFWWRILFQRIYTIMLFQLYCKPAQLSRQSARLLTFWSWVRASRGCVSFAFLVFRLFCTEVSLFGVLSVWPSGPSIVRSSPVPKPLAMSSSDKVVFFFCDLHFKTLQTQVWSYGICCFQQSFSFISRP